jgi:uncharacterized membrane protein YqiK
MLILVAIPVGLLIFLGIVKWFLRWYVKVDQGKALIINKLRGAPEVTFTGGLIIPIVNRAEIMDISLKTIEIDRKGSEGLICQDNIRADIKVTFFVRINNTKEDVMNVAQSIGCERASREATIQELFQAKFSEALKTAGRKMDFVDLYQERTNFKQAIITSIGDDLNGYKLEDVAIDYLEQTPITSLSPDNILDSQGIKKITEMTAAEKIKANEIRRHQEMTITQQDVNARETILEQQRRQQEAELKQRREVDVIRSREEAEAKKVASEEFLRSETARIKSEEEIAIANENAMRQIQVAQKNKERVIAIETERVTRDQQLEILARERAVELQRIDKEKALEVERKAIQDVIRERVIVEKSVAEEEERIKDTRAFMTADRAKKVAITSAEQAAQESLVKDIKHAEAQEISAKHKAGEMLTLAQAELTRAQKVSDAKVKMAEGQTAEAAAEGLAKVKVKEADAAAIEKVGFAEARALREKGNAESETLKSRALAEAVGIQEKGAAEAGALKAHALAEAAGIQEKGIAEGKATEARAIGNQKQYLAEAEGGKQKMLADAEGITQKAEAMKLLDEASRGHEEFRLRLRMEQDLKHEQINRSADVALEQAKVLAEAFKTAKIDIVGGDGQFFDRMINAISGGKSLDAYVDKSHVAQKLGHEYLEGEASLRGDIKDVLVNSNLTSEDLKNLSVAGMITKLMAGSDDATRKKLQKLLNNAQTLGIADTGSQR